MTNESPTAAGAAPTVIMAFQGWNDVAGAAYSAVDHLVSSLKAERIDSIDPEDFYDFQVNQPRVDVVDGKRTVIWRSTEMFRATTADGQHLVLIRGIEPSYRWKAFTKLIVEFVEALRPERVVLVGALPGETAHTRPFPVTTTSPQESVRAMHGAKAPNYVGPTGIVGVLIDALTAEDFPVLSQWVVIPQYATGGPAPKASWALMNSLSDLLDTPLPLGDLEEESRGWERGVSELVDADSSMIEYVANLERSSDISQLPEASGDAIAKQFEQFLRRRDNDSL